MLLQVSCILIFHFVWVTSALQCLNCEQTLNLESSETINTSRSECKLGEPQQSPCSQLLHVRYSEKSASVSFKAASNELLILPNAARLMTNTTKIWLDKNQMERTFQIFCFDGQACNASAISDIYIQGESEVSRSPKNWGRGCKKF